MVGMGIFQKEKFKNSQVNEPQNKQRSKQCIACSTSKCFQGAKERIVIVCTYHSTVDILDESLLTQNILQRLGQTVLKGVQAGSNSGSNKVLFSFSSSLEREVLPVSFLVFSVSCFKVMLGVGPRAPTLLLSHFLGFWTGDNLMCSGAQVPALTSSQKDGDTWEKHLLYEQGWCSHSNTGKGGIRGPRHCLERDMG